MNNAKKEIVSKIRKISGKYSPDMVFSDWVCCCALAIQNACCLIHDSAWHSREEQYRNVIKKYEIEERRELADAFTLLVKAFEEEVSDILGEIYMESRCGSKQTGQFFTPYHISYLTAEMSIANENISEDEMYTIHEPSVGGGGMIIATAMVLKNRGINYQRCMRVVAQDLDWRSVYMAYIQFSLLGIDAIVVQGDTLSTPYDERTTEPSRILRTPNRMGVLI